MQNTTSNNVNDLTITTKLFEINSNSKIIDNGIEQATIIKYNDIEKKEYDTFKQTHESLAKISNNTNEVFNILENSFSLISDQINDNFKGLEQLIVSFKSLSESVKYKPINYGLICTSLDKAKFYEQYINNIKNAFINTKKFQWWSNDVKSNKSLIRYPEHAIGLVNSKIYVLGLIKKHFDAINEKTIIWLEGFNTRVKLTISSISISKLITNMQIMNMSVVLVYGILDEDNTLHVIEFVKLFVTNLYNDNLYSIGEQVRSIMTKIKHDNKHILDQAVLIFSNCVFDDNKDVTNFLNILTPYNKYINPSDITSLVQCIKSNEKKYNFLPIAIILVGPFSRRHNKDVKNLIATMDYLKNQLYENVPNLISYSKFIFVPSIQDLVLPTIPNLPFCDIYTTNIFDASSQIINSPNPLILSIGNVKFSIYAGNLIDLLLKQNNIICSSHEITENIFDILINYLETQLLAIPVILSDTTVNYFVSMCPHLIIDEHVHYFVFNDKQLKEQKIEKNYVNYINSHHYIHINILAE